MKTLLVIVLGVLVVNGLFATNLLLFPSYLWFEGQALMAAITLPGLVIALGALILGIWLLSLIMGLLLAVLLVPLTLLLLPLALFMGLWPLMTLFAIVLGWMSCQKLLRE